jgi:hypothetical protein
MGLLMLTAEQAVLRCPATGEQKQGHFNAEGLLKQRHHSTGLGQSTAADRLEKGLPRFGAERSEKAVQPMHLKGLGRGHPSHMIKAVFQAIFTDVESVGQIRDGQWITAMKRKVLQRMCHHLQWVIATPDWIWDQVQGSYLFTSVGDLPGEQKGWI